MATIDEVVDALVTPLTRMCLVDAEMTGPSVQSAVFSTPLQDFPTAGTEYVVLSSGDASLTPGVAPTFVSNDTGGPVLPGTDPLASPDGVTSFDVVTVRLEFLLPKNPGKLTFDWKFGTEENPEFVGQVADYFRADIITSQTTENIALLPDGSPVTVDNAAPFSNAPGGNSMAPLPPYPTPNDVTYNAMTTEVYTSEYDLSCLGCEIITLQIRVADVFDRFYNSAAFIDNLRITGCEETNQASSNLTKPKNFCCGKDETILANDDALESFTLECGSTVSLYESSASVDGTFGIYYESGCSAFLTIRLEDEEGNVETMNINPGNTYNVTIKGIVNLSVECPGPGTDVCYGVYSLVFHYDA